MTTPTALIEALRVRYHSATFGDRIKILDEFVALAGGHWLRSTRNLLITGATEYAT